MVDRVRCINCGHSLDSGALICGECGRVQPPAGEGPEWVDSEEYAIGGGDAERSSWTVVWAALSLVAALFHFALLDARAAAAVPALGIVWSATGLMTAPRGSGPSPALRAAMILYGMALAAFVAGAGVVLLRVL